MDPSGDPRPEGDWTDVPDVKAFIKGLPAWRKFAGLVTLLAILLALYEGNWLVFWLFVGAITISAIWEVVRALRRKAGTIQGPADSIREAMRLSYWKHYKMAEEGSTPVDAPPHPLGLFRALGTRYKVRNSLPKVGIPDVFLWPELAPFLLMSESQAVEALAEYIVWQECPSEARMVWLRESINQALRKQLASEDSPRTWASNAFINSAAWCELLDPDVHNQLSVEASDLLDEEKE